MLSDFVALTPVTIASPWPRLYCIITGNPILFASSIVPSVEPPSITTISSAHDLLIWGRIFLIPSISLSVRIKTAVDNYNPNSRESKIIVTTNHVKIFRIDYEKFDKIRE